MKTKKMTKIGKLFICENINNFEDTLVELFISLIRRQAVLNPDKILNVALAGGLTPLSFYTKLSNNIRFQKYSKFLKIFLTDERGVPNYHPQSNGGNLKKTFYNYNLELLNHNLPDPSEDYEKRIRESLILGSNKFDLILLGMGADGHIASIFDSTTFSINRIYHTVQIQNFSIIRYSLSMKEIVSANNIIIVIGNQSDKLELIDRMIKNTFDSNLPIEKLISERGQDLIWVILKT
jgi:6-phosphogluconolactonase